MRSLSLIARLTAAAFVVWLAAGCSSDANSTPLPAVGIETPVALSADGWRLTVMRAHTTPTVRTHRALGVYVVVTLAMENIGKQGQTLCGDRFKIKDSQGREYKYYSDGTIDYGDQELCDRINPGLRGQAAVVFDLPKDATGLVLESLGGFRAQLGDVANLP